MMQETKSNTSLDLAVNNMDKTLGDYIKRVMESQEKEIAPTAANDDEYLVYPEQPQDSDHKVNPYSKV